jgi:hypothetical protein
VKALDSPIGAEYNGANGKGAEHGGEAMKIILDIGADSEHRGRGDCYSPDSRCPHLTTWGRTITCAVFRPLRPLQWSDHRPQRWPECLAAEPKITRLDA